MILMVYVDDMAAPYGSMIMCHLLADTREELLEMVDTIKVQRKWIQKKDTPYEHFDICIAKKKLAIQHGAKRVTSRQLIEVIKRKRQQLKDQS